MKDAKQTPVASARPKRTPLAGRQRLVVRDKDPNYHYRIVNANLEKDPERVQDFIERGYEIVPRTEVGHVSDSKVGDPSSLGSSSMISVGGGTKAVVMRQRKDWYDEDQKAKQQEINELEASMKRPSNLDYGSIKID